MMVQVAEWSTDVAYQKFLKWKRAPGKFLLITEYWLGYEAKYEQPEDWYTMVRR